MRTVKDLGMIKTSNGKNSNSMLIMEKTNTFNISGINQNHAMDNVKFYKN
jgi:hypothetical protein